jgi:hypothetical protein
LHDKKYTQFSSANPKGRDHLGNLSVREKIILKWMSRKYIIIWTGFMWLRI